MWVKISLFSANLASKILLRSGIQDNQGTSGLQKLKSPLSDNPKLVNTKKDTLCKLYTRGKCRHRDECRFDHPKMCNKFRSFGLKIFNEKGCENNNCKFFHPNACRDSIKNNTCPRPDCWFFHITDREVRHPPGNGKRIPTSKQLKAALSSMQQESGTNYQQI